MLARRRTCQLRGGVQIRTPLIIPSLSTRNVGQIDVDGVPCSLASAVLELVGGQLEEAMLVSAYDLSRGRMVDAERLLTGDTTTVYANADLLMLDSGLYETRERVGYDDGAAASSDDWSEEKYSSLIAGLPPAPIAIVNFDDASLPYSEQIDRARALFAAHPTRLSVMLLKPERTDGFIDDARLAPATGDLRGFDIVAVTEKELGNTLLQRLRMVKLLRELLDRGQVTAPLHIFGGLDPLLTPLYIACGAEIVDGVGWLRYAYMEDGAQHLETRAVLDLDLDSRVPTRIFTTVSRNLLFLRDLKHRLEILVSDRNFSAYSPTRGPILEDIWRRVGATEEVQ
jgi:hypothetical protein